MSVACRLLNELFVLRKQVASDSEIVGTGNQLLQETPHFRIKGSFHRLEL